MAREGDEIKRAIKAKEYTVQLIKQKRERIALPKPNHSQNLVEYYRVPF